MPLTLLEPFNLNTGSNYTFNSANVTANIAAGNLAVTGVSNLGAVGNVVITGGSSGQFLTTNGSGNLSWASISTSSISNGNSNVTIPAANGNVNISSSGNANIVVVTGTGANIAGTLNVSGNANAGNIGATGGLFTTVAGSLTTAAQPNITSVGTLSSAAITGNVTAGNVYANSGTVGASLLAGTLTTAAQPNITSLGTLSSLAVTGNITSGNFTGVFANGNSTVSIPAANGNIEFNSGGTATPELTVTNTGVNVAGTFNSTGRLVSGAVSYANTDGTNGQVLTTYGNGTTYWSTVSGGGGGGANIANGNSNVSIATSGGNVTTSVAGNANILTITGTGVNVAGTLAVSGVSNLGPASNVIITGGSAGYFLSTDGAGNLSWALGGGGGGGGAYISNGTTSVNIPASGGNVEITVGGANFGVFSQPSLAVNANITTTGFVGAASNITAPVLISNVSNGTPPFSVFSNTLVPTLYVARSNVADTVTTTLQTTGTYFIPLISATANSNYALNSNANFSVNAANGAIIATTFAGNATTAGTVTTAAQPNITSVGSLGSLTVTGNANVGNIGGASGVFTSNVSAVNLNATGTVNAASLTITNLSSNNWTVTGPLAGNSSVATVGATFGLRAVSSTYTDNAAAASGTIANSAIHAIGTPTLAATNTGVTATNAATFFIQNAPTAGTNMTIGNAWALYVAAGNSLLGGNLVISAANGRIQSNGISVTGAMTGNANASTLTGNLGLRALATTYTDNSAAVGATLANAAIHGIGTPTLAAANTTVTSTNAATFFIQGAPTAGTNMTIGNAWALYVAAGNSFFGGSVTVGNIIYTGVNSTVFANNHTANGAATGNANVATVTGNLGFRAISSTYTDNSAAASGTLANAAIHAIGTPTLAAANATVTATNAATFFIQNAPTAGTNMTIGNAWALYVGSGASFFGGNIRLAGNILGVIANGTTDINIPTANGNMLFDVGGVANVVTFTTTGIANTRVNIRTANNGANTSGTLTPNSDTTDQFNMAGLSGTVTIASPSGTPVDGQKLNIRIKDAGTAQSLVWTTGGANAYRPIGTTLPTTTTANKYIYVGCIYNSTDSFWDVVAVNQEA
jgi:hypothetical protein